MSEPATKRNLEAELQEHIAGFVYDPLGFVLFAFPWGEPGELKDETGPDEWQTQVLHDIGRELEAGSTLGALLIAVRSGHGIGKTALIAWLIIWFMSTRPNPQIPVTANTKEQLTSKTWRELAKWSRLAINSHWFKWTATKFSHVDCPETWFASAIPWSKERSEAFAGTHEKYVLMVYDEGSAIDDVIWEVSEGAMTTDGAMWVVFGNPTRNTGRFFECFNKYRHRWKTYEIDSRKAKKANQDQIKKWAEDYGEDSDFFRVRVKGQAPRQGVVQFIPSDLVERAATGPITPDQYSFAPKVLGVDVARFGDDQSVILKRQGLCARFPVRKFRGVDTMRLASLVAEEIAAWKPDAVMVDVVGIGAGVVDRLRQLGHDVIEVNAGAAATDDKTYHNKRVEMWGKLRDWLKAGGVIEDDAELKSDLTAPEYTFDAKERFVLESKDDLKARGMASPDSGDALALTFAENIVVIEKELPPLKNIPLAGYYGGQA